MPEAVVPLKLKSEVAVAAAAEIQPLAVNVKVGDGLWVIGELVLFLTEAKEVPEKEDE